MDSIRLAVSVSSFSVKERTTPYKTLRPLLKTGDYLVCSGEGLFSKVIRRLTGSWASHVGKVVVDRDLDRVFIAESVETIGTRLYPLSRYVAEYDGRLILMRHASWKNADLKAFGQFVIDRQGRKYDNKEIARITARLMGVVVGRTPDQETICSEFAWEADQAAGVGLPWPSQDDFIAPSHFAKGCEMIGEIEK